MKIDPAVVVKEALDLVLVLWADDGKTGPEKLALVEAKYVPLFETLDDELVASLPVGWQALVKILVDNPLVDGLEVKLARLLAEQTYLLVKAAKTTFGL